MKSFCFLCIGILVLTVTAPAAMAHSRYSSCEWPLLSHRMDLNPYLPVEKALAGHKETFEVDRDTVVQNDLLDWERSAVITNHAWDLETSREPQQLLITFSGLAHTYDYFDVRGARAGVAYLMPDFGDVKLEEHAPYKLARRLEGIELEDRKFVSELLLQMLSQQFSPFHDDMFSLLFAAAFEESLAAVSTYWQQLLTYTQYYTRFRAGKSPFAPSFHHLSAEFPQVIHIGDVHFSPAVDYISDLPSPEILQRQNISEVIVAVEGRDYSVIQSRARVLKLAKFNLVDSTYRLTNAQQQLIKRSLSSPEFAPAGLGPLLENGVVMNEVLKALIRRADDYEAHGIRVTYKGLD